MTGHELVEMMASTWDEAGSRPPTNWRFVCTCGVTVRGLRGQVEASDAWQAHKAASGLPQVSRCSLCGEVVRRRDGSDGYGRAVVNVDGSRHAHDRPWRILADTPDGVQP